MSSSGSTRAVAEARAKRTALWVHLYDPHDPVRAAGAVRHAVRRPPYDGEVAWTDTLLGRLRASLEARQLWDDALVVVTADHGEALGEHGETGHGFFAYETTLQVPLVMRGPGAAGRAHRSTAPSGSSTWRRPSLELLGLPPLAGTHTGASLAAHLAAGGTADRAARPTPSR